MQALYNINRGKTTGSPGRSSAHAILSLFTRSRAPRLPRRLNPKSGQLLSLHKLDCTCVNKLGKVCKNKQKIIGVLIFFFKLAHRYLIIVRRIETFFIVYNIAITLYQRNGIAQDNGKDEIFRG